MLHRHRNAATALVGTGAAAAVLVGILLLMNTGSNPGAGPGATDLGSPTSPTLTEVTGCCKIVPVVARAVQRSMVSLVVTQNRGTTVSCGVAVAQGGLVATTFDAVRGARSVTAVTAGGERERARVVATDRRSDIALVRISGDLPLARFAGDTSLSTGHPVMVMALDAKAEPGEPTVTMWSSGTIRSVGTAVTKGDASGMAGIDAVAPSMPTMAGELLLAPQGGIMGILDSTGSSTRMAGSKVFLPAQLVVGVADDLATSNQVRHGWLDVVGHDTGSGNARGAMVVKVDHGGASTGALQAGDVILGIDGTPVRSMAELRSRLYVLEPGTRVRLRILRGGDPETVAITLSAFP